MDTVAGTPESPQASLQQAMTFMAAISDALAMYQGVVDDLIANDPSTWTE